MNIEPDRSEVLFCPDCALWYSRETADGDLVWDESRQRAVENFYCTNTNHKDLVKLLDAHAFGELTPWEEWKAEQLMQQLRSHEAAAERIRDELRDYYHYE